MHNPARSLKKLIACFPQITYLIVHSSQEEETEATCLPLTKKAEGKLLQGIKTMAFFISNLNIPSIQI